MLNVKTAADLPDHKLPIVSIGMGECPRCTLPRLPPRRVRGGGGI
jgi:hypothetical protein